MSKTKFTLIINDDNDKISIEMRDRLTKTKVKFKISKETTSPTDSIAGWCKLVFTQAKEMYREKINK